jgi:hypothetical protein
MPETPTRTTAARPEPTDRNPDGSARFSTYDEYYEALIDWKVEQKVRELLSPEGRLRIFLN